MVAPAEPRAPRGAVLRIVLLVALLLGAPWVARRWLGTTSWREVTERTQGRLIEVALAAGPWSDPVVNGSPDFGQAWGVDDSDGPAKHRSRFTFRRGGAGSPRLSVDLIDLPSGPEASIHLDDLGIDVEGLRGIARELERFFAEREIPIRAVEEREIVRVTSGESFEVPAGRILNVREIGLVATGSSTPVASEVLVSADAAELLRHGFGGTLHASGMRVAVGDDLEYSLTGVRAVRAGERLTVTESSGLQAYVLAELSHRRP